MCMYKYLTSKSCSTEMPLTCSTNLQIMYKQTDLLQNQAFCTSCIILILMNIQKTHFIPSNILLNMLTSNEF